MNGSIRTGYLQAILAYGLWGCFPLYFAMFSHIPSLEVVAHRVLWSLVTCVVLLTLSGSFAQLRDALRDKRLTGFLSVASFLIAINWLTYVYAVATGRTLDAALGYFINPLATTALGVIVLQERLRRLQWLAVGFGVVAVAVLIAGYGRLPWISLVLAGTFGGYALVKKVASRSAGALVGMTIETGVLTPVAAGYLVVLSATGQASQQVGSWQWLLLASTGVVTAVPLLWFASAAARIPLLAIGLLQYVAPTAQFLVGWLVFHETMSAARWAGFALVWAGIGVFIIDGLRSQGILNRCVSSMTDPPKT